MSKAALALMQEARLRVVSRLLQPFKTPYNICLSWHQTFDSEESSDSIVHSCKEHEAGLQELEARMNSLEFDEDSQQLSKDVQIVNRDYERMILTKEKYKNQVNTKLDSESSSTEGVKIDPYSTTHLEKFRRLSPSLHLEFHYLRSTCPISKTVISRRARSPSCLSERRRLLQSMPFVNGLRERHNGESCVRSLYRSAADCSDPPLFVADFRLSRFNSLVIFGSNLPCEQTL
ncbi:hypothetical protein RF11_05158 [Thelohanellus kitauei]|uniref:Uncharacterized protein n=1 Tax=Thelohanellus kitauei TaxID=669202 RepID=A0A0C2MEE4_THEKT|nr:hypothetical protein RF11_05158 [Thelohanellus kitauei]